MPQTAKETLSTPAWVTRYSLTSRCAGTMLTTPRREARVADGVGEQIGVQRRLRRRPEHQGAAGQQRRGSFSIVVACGTFHGTIAAITPSGSRVTRAFATAEVRTELNG